MILTGLNARFAFLLFPLFCAIQGFSQTLLPSIGIGPLPADSTAICPLPVYTGSFYTSGIAEGATVPDFTLYTLSGAPVNLQTELQAGQPVLLVAGSYTCPVFRNKIPELNAITSFYSGQLKVLVVYTAEAHPVTDPSPYSGNIWVTSQNQQQGVLYPQPVNYGERKTIAAAMLSQINIMPELLIDGPCNNWWLNFGPAPNNAYLIGTDGKVKRKHGWFNKAPDNMYCAIDSLLGITSGNCQTLPNNGTFSLILQTDSTAYGGPGDVLSVHATLTNQSATANAVFQVMRLQQNLPMGWSSALCSDICYSPTTDTITVTLPPLAAQSFIFYFYSDFTSSQGDVLVGFRNQYVTANKFKQRFYGFTNALGASEITDKPQAHIFPNPAADWVTVKVEESQPGMLFIHDLQGRLQRQFMYTGQGEEKIGLNGLQSGLYLLSVKTQTRLYTAKLVIE